MKHKVLIGAIITTLVAFLLYTTNLKRVDNAKLKVVGPTTSKVNKKKKPRNQRSRR